MLISDAMVKSETPVVYAMAFAAPISESVHYIVSSSQSQGFAWNQDIFASQYQQMCRVVYDGHEDQIDTILERVRALAQRDNAMSQSEDVFDDEDQDMDSYEAHIERRVSQELMQPRRRSERSISFVSDSKNGQYQRAETIVIDIHADTDENRHFKALLAGVRA